MFQITQNEAVLVTTGKYSGYKRFLSLSFDPFHPISFAGQMSYRIQRTEVFM